MPKQSNRSRTLKTTAHPQEAGYELIFWAIEDILELGLNGNESAALRRIIAMGSQAFYDSLGEQGLQLLARRRVGAQVRIAATQTPNTTLPSRLDSAGSFEDKARLTAKPSPAEQDKIENRTTGPLNKATEEGDEASAASPFSDMRSMAISRNTIAR